MDIDEDYCEIGVSDSDSDDPNYDFLEEARSEFSQLSVDKKGKKTHVREYSGSSEDIEEAVQVTVPELDEKDQKSFEIVHNLIQDGKVDKLKLDQCKVYLRKHGLRLTGNKETLIHRIKEHLEIINGGGEKRYPPSSFVINCKGDACTGDVVMFKQNVYDQFNLASRSANGPPKQRIVACRIIKESYGAAKQQHTFTVEVLWSKGEKPLPPLHPMLIKGRNLYWFNTMRQRWEDETDRQKILMDKHSRGSLARSDRAARLLEKERRKASRGKRLPRKREERVNQAQSGPFVVHQEPRIPVSSAAGFVGNPRESACGQHQDPVIVVNPHGEQNHHHRHHSVSMKPVISQSILGRYEDWHHNYRGSSTLCSRPTNHVHDRETGRRPLGNVNQYPKNRAQGPGARGEERRQLCRHFVGQGRCHYGDNCKFLHQYH